MTKRNALALLVVCALALAPSRAAAQAMERISFDEAIARAREESRCRRRGDLDPPRGGAAAAGAHGLAEALGFQPRRSPSPALSAA